VPAVETTTALAGTWTLAQPKLPSGRLKPHRFRSDLLDNERRVWVYTPPGYTRAGGPYGLLVLFDGATYADRIPTATILDNLLAESRIAPTIALLVDSLDEETRDRELACYLPFVGFLADELLPWARARYRLTDNPARTIVGGSSYGGLSAAFAALTRPDQFGKVLSQSGSFWWKPDDDAEHEWLARQFVDAPPLPIEFYLSVGLREAKARVTPHQLTVNRHMRNVLRAKGYMVHYAELEGGHDEHSWRENLADGLLALAGIERAKSSSFLSSEL
jgi:enterochelin esterase family protein